MNKRLGLLWALALCLAATGIGAQDAPPAEKTEGKKEEKQPSSTADRGIMKEFRRLEEELLKRRRSAEFRQKTLTENLLRAMRNSVARRFYAERAELLKNLTPESLEGNYDNPTSPLIYYVRFRAGERLIIARFDYIKDPEFFIQGPSYEKLLVKDLTKAHKSDKDAGKKQQP